MLHKRPALSLCLQVSLQDKDSKDIETIIEEIENFQKVRSEYIVKFYGAEVHHVSLGLTTHSLLRREERRLVEESGELSGKSERVE